VLVMTATPTEVSLPPVAVTIPPAATSAPVVAASRLIGCYSSCRLPFYGTCLPLDSSRSRLVWLAFLAVCSVISAEAYRIIALAFA
jgi:hypothetical protein